MILIRQFRLWETNPNLSIQVTWVEFISRPWDPTFQYSHLCPPLDYSQGIEACCKFYLGLLDSSSVRVQYMACAHLARLSSNGPFHSFLNPEQRSHHSYYFLFLERWRSLVTKMQAIERLSVVLFKPSSPSYLHITITNIFVDLMSIGVSRSTPLIILLRHLTPRIILFSAGQF